MPRAGHLLTMDTAGYSKWDNKLEEVPGGHWGHWGQRSLLLAFGLVVVTVLWALVLSILFSKASTERGALLGHQDLLRTNASKQTATLKVLKEEVRACNSCCLGVQAQLQTVHTQLGEAKAKLLEQESALKELSERVTQGLAEAGRDRENIRSELFRELERVRFQNSSCEQCPKSWLPFQGSCYFFSAQGATWVEAQSHCEGAGAHLVIVGGLEEQVRSAGSLMEMGGGGVAGVYLRWVAGEVMGTGRDRFIYLPAQGFLSRNTAGRGYWLGLRAVRRARKIQSYQWVDGVPLSFSHWNLGEPNDSLGREDCIMMLRTGMWNDAPCNSKDDSWICEKRHNC
uniref:C-type lectin domain-containing protein n=1 Tax=Sus scrofa TaxID=9823 RepID=A0A4X1VN44_PIG